MLNHFKYIKWMLLVKRLGAYAVDNMIWIIPISIVSIKLYFIEGDLGLLDFYDHSSGLLLFEILLIVITYFGTSAILLGCVTLEKFLIQLTFIIPVFVSFLGFEILTALIFRNDLGSLLFGLIIVDNCGRRASRWRIVLRTFLKYLTVFLCPILLLFPLFNRRNACLHELIAGAYKVEKPKPVYPPMYYPPQQQ